MVFVGGHMMGGGGRGGGFRGATAGSGGRPVVLKHEKYGLLLFIAFAFCVLSILIHNFSGSMVVTLVCNSVLLVIFLIAVATRDYKWKKTQKENTITPAVDEEAVDDEEIWLQLLKKEFKDDMGLLTQLFNSYDKDQDGFLDEDEMRSLLADLAKAAMARLGELQQQLRGAMKAEQAQGNPEWGTLLMYRGVTTSLKSLGNVPDNQMNTQEIVRKRFDISKDGKISKEEFIVRAPIVAQELCDPIPEVD